MERNYGSKDTQLVPKANEKIRVEHMLGILAALLFIFLVWFALDQKLLFGEDWISQTYDNTEWRTNEGNLPTYGAWDLETHIWKTQFIMENFPNYGWNPYWYLGMPLLEYYQPTFYFVHILVIMLTGLSIAKSALYLIIFGHLLAVFTTFLVCYQVSKRIFVSALCSIFVLANTFLTLRSYGWEPITVVFLFLYPLGLYFFLRDPIKPFRLTVILTLTASYISHPLIFFSLCMAMGLYLITIALRRNEQIGHTRYLWHYFAAILVSILVGAVHFIPQMSYVQQTSGAHMGVTYLPYYHVPYNIITLKDFFFDAGNLKGPGPIIMIAGLLFLIYAFIDFKNRKKHTSYLLNHELISGLSVILFMMVLFYYLELYSIFPMNLLRSIQYHRIIPEFVITACILVAAMSNINRTTAQKIIYYSLLVSFVAISSIIIYNVQEFWQTTSTLEGKPEFINEQVPGRVSFPYTDQSFSVRNSFQNVEQVYGYYEQGITNPYTDELFSVSSGFHNANLAILYLKAANVGRLYINKVEGFRDALTSTRLNGTLTLVPTENPRYGYYPVPLTDPSFAQAVDYASVLEVKNLDMGCRELFKEHYCGSAREEFVGKDLAEVRYLASYVGMLEEPYASEVDFVMINPDNYQIQVRNADVQSAIIVKMTYHKNFEALLDGRELAIEPIGPYFMLIYPQQAGSYLISLEYQTSKARLAGMIISGISLPILLLLFALKPFKKRQKTIDVGDMQ